MMTHNNLAFSLKKELITKIHWTELTQKDADGEGYHRTTRRSISKKTV